MYALLVFSTAPVSGCQVEGYMSSAEKLVARARVVCALLAYPAIFVEMLEHELVAVFRPDPTSLW